MCYFYGFTKDLFININNQELRNKGISASIDLNKRSLSKQLDYANKLGVAFTIIVGPEELKEGKVRLRNMKTGEEKEIGLNELKDYFL